MGNNQSEQSEQAYELFKKYENIHKNEPNFNTDWLNNNNEIKYEYIYEVVEKICSVSRFQHYGYKNKCESELNYYDYFSNYFPDDCILLNLSMVY